MRKLSLLALVGWSIVALAASAQQAPPPLSRDRLCQDVRTGMSVQDVLSLAASVGIQLVPTVSEDDTVVVQWSDAETSEEFTASFIENDLANFSCSMVVSNRAADAAEPTTCDRINMGMSVDAVKTFMADAGFTALPRRLGSDNSLWEWSNSQTAEFVRTIFSNGQVVSLSCSTQANETESLNLENIEPQNPDNFLDFGEQLPGGEELPNSEAQ